ncbi:MAG TPA: AraC family ligand binding domain-containing protein [Oceanobacillus sp.]|nr:AraC family ligand binding domain-containing protein [Oceanobacillus sp.]
MARYKPGFYLGRDEAGICAALSCEGYRPQRIEEPPGAVYDAQRHLTDILIAYVQGSAEVRVGDRIYNCRAGDRLLIPGNIEHSAKIGPEGVVYLMTEIEALAD